MSAGERPDGLPDGLPGPRSARRPHDFDAIGSDIPGVALAAARRKAEERGLTAAFWNGTPSTSDR